MTEKNKAMSDKEIADKYRLGGYEQLTKIVNDARIGYIPADRAIEVPDVGEWPEDANEIRVEWAHNSGGVIYKYPLIAVIPRPVPAFIPEVGDLCFCRFENETIGIGRCDAVNEDGWQFMTMNFDHTVRMFSDVKKFNPSKIGLPWEEI